MADTQKSDSKDSIPVLESLPKIVASNIPFVAPVPPPSLEITDGYRDEHFTDGLYKDRKTGEPFALCKRSADAYERTHALKNTQHFCLIKEDEFFTRFERA